MDNEIKSPLKTIREYCLTCCCESAYEVKACPAKDCKLYAYRLGHDPRREKRVLTDQERQTMRDRFARARSPVDTRAQQ